MLKRLSLSAKRIKMNWTKEQETAIKTQNKNIIVSAAAGSGKTAVLVERIFSIMYREKISIDKMLVLTYTNAAAKEMKDRLTSKLYEKLSETGSDPFLISQLKNIQTAQISTVHSFCLNTIRENFEKLDIDPAFKVGTAPFINILKNKALDEVLQKYYDESGNEFLDLIDIYSGRTDDEPFKKIIFNIYDFLQNRLDTLDWFKKAIKAYSPESSDERYLKIYSGLISENLQSFILQNNSCLEMCENDEELDSYSLTLEYDKSILQELKAALEKSYFEFAQKLSSISFPRLPTKKASSEDVKLLKKQIQTLRNSYKDALRNEDNFYLKSKAQSETDSSEIYALLQKLYELLEDFSDTFSRLKNKYSVSDFNDLEHMMLKLLEDESLTNKLQSKYSYVFYDEYQDSNSIQSKIADTLQNGGNLFFVGDVKQSIYGFRNAEPTVFTDKYACYSKGENNIKIDLNENFRSSAQILTFCNIIFSKLMNKKTIGIAYDENQKLKTDAPCTLDPEKIKLCLIYDDSKTKTLSKTDREAVHCAQKIKSLIGKTYFDRKTCKEEIISYKDIVILLRSPKNITESYKNIFRKENIPLITDGNFSSFDDLEIAIFIDFLKIIDNPRNDDALLSVMSCELGAFSINEIAQIKIFSEEDSFYNAVKSYTNSNNDSVSLKINSLFDMIDRFAKAEKLKPLSLFITEVLNSSGYISYVNKLPQGTQRERNLNSFVDLAREFEQNRKNSLHYFLTYLSQIKKGKTDNLSPISQEELPDAVRLMSIHKSKGLEFPVVFLSNLSRIYNMDDLREKILLNGNYGIGAKHYDNAHNASYTTIIREVVSDEIAKAIIFEEIRVLYVALTRAKDYLYLVSSISSEEALEKTLSENNVLSEYVSLENILTQKKSFLNLLLFALKDYIEPYTKENNILEPQKKLAFSISIANLEQSETEYEENLSAENPEDFIALVQNTKSDFDIKAYSKYFDFEYPYKFESYSPVKRSVTGLKKTSEFLGYKIEKISSVDTAAMSKSKDPAKEGSFTHTLLKHLNYSGINSKEDIEDTLNYLIKEQILPHESKEIIDTDSIYKFVNSEIGLRLKKADNIHREESFITEYEAFGEKFILNGIIDLYFEENGNIILIDFKTDSVNNYNVNKRINEYRMQIELYKKALSKAYNKNVAESYIYFLKVEKAVLA